jgi:hypothetical protein
MKHMTAILAALLAGSAPAAAQPTFEEVQRKTEDITRLIEAENSKSELCKQYEGTIVTPTTFDALALSLPKVAPKGEYETTAQFEARKSSALAKAPTGLSVLIVPTDRDYATYEADDETLFVQAGAFQAGAYSPHVEAVASAWLALGKGEPQGIGLFMSDKERVIRTYSAQNILGATTRVSEIDRETKALHLVTDELFRFAKWKRSPVIGLTLPLAKAPSLKQSFRVALVVKPVAPFVTRGDFDGPPAKVGRPTQYTDHATLLIVEPKCGLVLDSSQRVLASADAGR